jgi:nondiscriminating aspartyl-tRNA synthetase
MSNISNISPRISSPYVNVELLHDHIGQTVQIRGTIYKIREMSGFAFVVLQTQKTFLQCVYSEKSAQFNLSELCENMSAVFTGKVLGDPRSRSGIELELWSYICLSVPVCEPPVVINNAEIKASLDTLLDYRPVTLRNAKEKAIFQIQAGICRALRKFFDENNFTEIHSPKIVFGGAEGGSNIFKLDYFGREAYLTQSPQFYKQIMVGIFERVYEIAPVFRAEKHDTSRHINEYTSVDLEMGFIENFYELMNLETKMLAETMDFLREYYPGEITLLKADIPKIDQIPAVAFCEAKEMVAKEYNRPITDFEDFDPEEEKLLCEIIKKQTGCDFVFVTHYKSSKRPFYAMDSKQNPELTESFDLLFRGMEITTGGQRIHDYGEQVSKMKARGMDPEAFSSYLMAHKHGLLPHGGLGLGLERLTAKLLNFQNIRRTVMFPRDIARLEP